MKVLLLGAGGFIGVHLTRRLVEDTDYDVTAVDISSKKLQILIPESQLSFSSSSDDESFCSTSSSCSSISSTCSLQYINCDITKDNDKLDELVSAHDIIIDLVAVANPSIYVTDPLGVFNLNFTENLKIVELCVKHQKRIIQFSTCEVYGMTVASVLGKDPMKMSMAFNEDTTPLIMGPIKNHRWIYASAKQLLERVLHAYGLTHNLNYTIIRPFNFVGPEIDYLPSEEQGNPRVFSHFMNALLYGTQMKLVDGGKNLRAYTYIDDAVDCMIKIIDNDNGVCDRQIFNIGKPDNELSIRQMAELMIDIWENDFSHVKSEKLPEIVDVSAEDFYGKGYEDCDRRIADISKAQQLLNWNPKTDLRDTIKKTMEYFVEKHLATHEQ